VTTTTLLLWASLAIAGSHGTTSGSPYCVYSSQSQELKCNCQNLYFNRSQPTVFPNNEFFVSLPSHKAEKVASEVKEVSTIKLSGCPKLHLALDLSPLPYPFRKYVSIF